MYKKQCVHTANGDFFKITKLKRTPSPKHRSRKNLATSAHKKILNSYAAAERRLFRMSKKPLLFLPNQVQKSAKTLNFLLYGGASENYIKQFI